MNIRDSAVRLSNEQLLSLSKTSHQKTLLFVGSKNVGKTTLINRFLERNEPAKKTLTLEYTFARKSSSHNLMKDVCHIWELGGGTLFTSVLEHGHSFTSYGPLTAIVMLDLSDLGQLWSCLEALLEAIKYGMNAYESTKTLHTDHPDSAILDPFPVPLVIVGGKYDKFQEFEPEKKKIVCRCLRFISHVVCGSLVFYSSKDAALVKRAKDVLNHHGFGSPIVTTVCQDYNKAVCVPSGMDLLESIETMGTMTKCTLDKIRHIYTTHFPQDVSKLSSTALDNPANDPNFREPLVDTLRRQKDEELERYCQEMERRQLHSEEKRPRDGSH